MSNLEKSLAFLVKDTLESIESVFSSPFDPDNYLLISEIEYATQILSKQFAPLHSTAHTGIEYFDNFNFVFKSIVRSVLDVEGWLSEEQDQMAGLERAAALIYGMSSVCFEFSETGIRDVSREAIVESFKKHMENLDTFDTNYTDTKNDAEYSVKLIETYGASTAKLQALSSGACKPIFERIAGGDTSALLQVVSYKYISQYLIRKGFIAENLFSVFDEDHIVKVYLNIMEKGHDRGLDEDTSSQETAISDKPAKAASHSVPDTKPIKEESVTQEEPNEPLTVILTESSSSRKPRQYTSLLPPSGSKYTAAGGSTVIPRGTQELPNTAYPDYKLDRKLVELLVHLTRSKIVEVFQTWKIELPPVDSWANKKPQVTSAVLCLSTLQKQFIFRYVCKMAA